MLGLLKKIINIKKAGLLLEIVLLVSATLFLFSGFGFTYERTYEIGLYFTIALVVIILNQLREDSGSSGIIYLGMIALIFSSYVFRKYIFYLSYGVRAELVFYTLLFGALQIFGRTKIFSIKFVISAQLLLFFLFINELGGRVIFNDDHPSFLYRLQLLLEHFPKVPFYNTDWNAGYNAREFFATGSIGIFILFYPLLALLDLFSPSFLSNLESVYLYNYVIALYFFIILPWLTYFASTVISKDKRMHVLSSLLVISSSLGFYRWLLKYGTLGFCLSCLVAPAVFYLLIKLLSREKFSFLELIILVILSSFLVNWLPASIVIVIPCLYYLILDLRSWYYLRVIDFGRYLNKNVLIYILLMLLLNIPWLMGLFADSKIFKLLSQDSLPGSNHLSFSREQEGSLNLIGSFKNFYRDVVMVNPIIIFSIFYVLFLERGKKFFLYALLAGALLAIVILGPILKPQLELGRMINFLVIIFIPIGAQHFINLYDKLVNMAETKIRLGVSSARDYISFFYSASLPAMVLIGLTQTFGVISNKSFEKYRGMEQSVIDIVNACKELPEGRIFFAGFMLHEMGSTSNDANDGGHIAPLARFSNRDFYSFEYYHSRWSAVDPVPEEFLQRGDEGIEEFLNLINASSVITHNKEWSERFINNPNYFKIHSFEQFNIFIRKQFRSSYLLSGKGEIAVYDDSIAIKPDTNEVVVKFRYMPKLKVISGSAKIEPYPVFSEVGSSGKKELVSYIKINVENTDQQLLLAY